MSYLMQTLTSSKTWHVRVKAVDTDLLLCHATMQDATGLIQTWLTTPSSETTGSNAGGNRYVPTPWDWGSDFCPMGTSYALVAWAAENQTPDQTYCNLYSISGTTLTYEDQVFAGAGDAGQGVSLAVESSTTAWMLWWDSVVPEGILVKITRTGDSIAAGTEYNPTESAIEDKHNMALLDTDLLVVSYNNSGAAARVYDMDGGMSEGTEAKISGATLDIGSRDNLAILSTSSFVMAYNDSDGDDSVNLVAATVSGTTITFGTPVEITKSGVDLELRGIATVDASTVLVTYWTASSGGVSYYRTVSISGTTVTDDNNEVIVTALGSYNDDYIGNPVSGSVYIPYVTITDADAVMFVGQIMGNAVFYSGTDTLTQRATLSVTDVERGGMVVRADDAETVVVATANSADSVVVEQATSASTYATWTDLTGTHPQGAVKSVKEL